MHQAAYGGQPGVEVGLMGALLAKLLSLWEATRWTTASSVLCFAGSKLEDLGKEHHKKKEEEKYAQQHKDTDLLVTTAGPVEEIAVPAPAATIKKRQGYISDQWCVTDEMVC